MVSQGLPGDSVSLDFGVLPGEGEFMREMGGRLGVGFLIS
jgi:hypothetical protein